MGEGGQLSNEVNLCLVSSWSGFLNGAPCKVGCHWPRHGGGGKTTCAVRLCSGGPAASAAEGVG